MTQYLSTSLPNSFETKMLFPYINAETRINILSTMLIRIRQITQVHYLSNKFRLQIYYLSYYLSKLTYTNNLLNNPRTSVYSKSSSPALQKMKEYASQLAMGTFTVKYGYVHLQKSFLFRFKDDSIPLFPIKPLITPNKARQKFIHIAF